MNTLLIVNAGSSSLKCSLFVNAGTALDQHFRLKVTHLAGPARFEIRDYRTQPQGEVVSRQSLTPEQLDAAHGNAHEQALKLVLDWIGQHTEHTVTAIGHRVVHGGDAFSGPTVLDDTALEQLHRLVPLAPLHQPYNLKLIELCRTLLPHCPQVACFDTAFHSTIPALARDYALPRKLTEAGIRRYGFHGLSYEYIQQRLQLLDAARACQRVIIAHLGSGASMCALHQGQSIASTMGFTALEGLPMGSRSGRLDPGVLLYLMREYHMTVDDLELLLYKQSGWLGVSGISNDMQTLKNSEDPRARQAINQFVYRISRETGSLAAALGGVDAFVFTGGVGENDAELRAEVIRQNRWLGLSLDTTANADEGARLISPRDNPVQVFVIPTNEEAMIARHTVQQLSCPT